MTSVTRNTTCLIFAALVLASSQAAYGFGFVFAGEGNGVDVVAHPNGYDGTGGLLQVTVGIDPTSVNISEMTLAVRKVVETWNARIPTTGNIKSNLLPTGYDFESVLLHEMGHSLGLAHPNLASESGLGSSQSNGTKSTDGADNVFNVSAGADGVYGSADDLRGDDVNLHYFRVADNDPFATDLGVVDSTTYSRDLGNLPGGDNYSANADRSVGNLLGYSSTEAVMQQGTFFREVQRDLGADDVAGIRYAESGVDEIAGTADDYTLELVYAGEDASADIVIDFDSSETTFAVSRNNGSFITIGRFPRQTITDHIAITSTSIYLDPTDNWQYPLAGDFDDDQDVDVSDVINAVGGFGGAGVIDKWYADGDVDGDGDVDVSDIISVVGNFTGASASSNTLSSFESLAMIGDFDSHDHGEVVIPEPTSVGLMGLGGLALLARGRRG